MAHNNWLRFTARSGGAAEILVYDAITTGGVTALDIDQQIKAAGPIRQLTMRINSPGGDTMQAAAIFNMVERLKANGTRVTVVIDGIAASAASWIAMLGDEVVMPENSLMMIHDPAGVVIGGASDMRGIAGVLDTIKANMAQAYARKSGKPLAEIAQIMEDETWYGAAEAVEAGFADRIEQPIRIAASFDPGLFARHPPTPQTIEALAAQFWAKQGVKVPEANTAPAGSPSTTLLPADQHDAIWDGMNRRPH